MATCSRFFSVATERVIACEIGAPRVESASELKHLEPASLEVIPMLNDRHDLTSTIRCPRCGGEREERMPTDACQFFYECTHCGVVLQPLPGDCCVFCSYGTAPCPYRSEGPAIDGESRDGGG